MKMRTSSFREPTEKQLWKQTEEKIGLNHARLKSFAKMCMFNKNSFSQSKYREECKHLVKDVAFHLKINLTEEQIVVASLKLKNDAGNPLSHYNFLTAITNGSESPIKYLDNRLRNIADYALHYVNKAAFEMKKIA